MKKKAIFIYWTNNYLALVICKELEKETAVNKTEMATGYPIRAVDIVIKNLLTQLSDQIRCQ